MKLDLQSTFLLLDTDGDTIELPVTDDFWQQLMSGKPADPKIKLLAASEGRMVSAYEMTDDWDHWENHPAGDEVLVVLEGAMTLILEEGSEERLIELTAGKTAIVPRGVWHTAKVAMPTTLLAITPGQGSGHRPA
ncbi:MAG: cupin domain-containing protein [Planctomycetes bacterium]|nr:cupin domain-containing protein [Planctomycetota bacterium]